MDFYEHLLENYGIDDANKLIKSLDMPRTRSLILNNEKISDKQFKSEFPNVVSHPYVPHAFLYNKEEYDFGKSFYHISGAMYISDPSSLVVASLLDVKQDDIVLDMCAAPGGKTIQTSLKMQNEGVIIANDLSYSRALTLSQNIERLGRKNVIVTSNDLSKLPQKYYNFFTKIILDAPCSGSGMFRKEEKMAKDWTIEKVHNQSRIQKDLIELAYLLLAPGGTLLYSTCSYSKEENFSVIKYLLDNHPDMHLCKIDDLAQFSLTPASEGITLSPATFNGEGQYMCLLTKDGELINSSIICKSKVNFKELNYDLYGNLINKNNQIFISPTSLNLKEFNIIRNGLKLGELNKKVFIPDYHLSHFLTFASSIPLNQAELKKYLSGETIAKDFKKGFFPVSFKNINIGFIKSINGTLKNYFPKGLRNSYIIDFANLDLTNKN